MQSVKKDGTEMVNLCGFEWGVSVRIKIGVGCEVQGEGCDRVGEVEINVQTVSDGYDQMNSLERYEQLNSILDQRFTTGNIES